MADDSDHVVHEHRARFADTDQEGVVFYGTYVTYADEAFNAYLRAIGHDYDRIRADGWGLRVVTTELEYHESAHAGDRLQGAVRVESIGESSIDTACRILRPEDDVVLAAATTTHVAVDDAGESTVRVPEKFRQAVVAFQDVPPDPV